MGLRSLILLGSCKDFGGKTRDDVRRAVANVLSRPRTRGPFPPWRGGPFSEGAPSGSEGALF